MSGLPTALTGWLARVLHRELIALNDAGEPHLVRWTLWRWGDRALYLHRFVRDDASRDLHDHPKRFVTIGLWGRYREQYWPGEPWLDTTICVRDYRAPWIRAFSAEHRHRILVAPVHPCWTLAYVGGRKREWGFWTRSGWVPWRQYVGRYPSLKPGTASFGAEYSEGSD